MIKPCNNCKKQDICEIYQFVAKNCNMHPWELGKKIYEMPGFAALVSASPENDTIELECDVVEFIRTSGDYSTLVNGKLDEDEESRYGCSCSAPGASYRIKGDSGKCTGGGCGGCGSGGCSP